MTRLTPMAEHAPSLPWPVMIEAGDGVIAADLTIPEAARGLVIFATAAAAGVSVLATRRSLTCW